MQSRLKPPPGFCIVDVKIADGAKRITRYSSPSGLELPHKGNGKEERSLEACTLPWIPSLKEEVFASIVPQGMLIK